MSSDSLDLRNKFIELYSKLPTEILRAREAGCSPNTESIIKLTSMVLEHAVELASAVENGYQ